MPRRKKISNEQFARRFADLAEESLASLTPDEQDRRIAKFEAAVAKTVRAGRARASRTPRTPAIPLHTRARG